MRETHSRSDCWDWAGHRYLLRGGSLDVVKLGSGSVDYCMAFFLYMDTRTYLVAGLGSIGV